jgi:Multiubiquitin
MSEPENHHGDEHHDVFIHIDHKKYDPEQHSMSGNQIRAFAKPPIGPEYDLWLETPGPGDDLKIGDNQEVHLKRGMSFYSVLRHIDPGASNGATRTR